MKVERVPQALTDRGIDRFRRRDPSRSCPRRRRGLGLGVAGPVVARAEAGVGRPDPDGRGAFTLAGLPE